MNSANNDKLNSPELVTKTLDTIKDVNENKDIVREAVKYGKTPVYYGPTRSMVRPPATPGLASFIAQASTVEEIGRLLTKGKTEYKNVSAKTIRKWEVIAEARIAQLT